MSDGMILSEVSGGVQRIVLNRPDTLNAFNVRMHEELAAAIARGADDPEVRVLLLTGAGRAFCAGQDLGDRKPAADGSPPDLGHSLEAYYNPLIRRLTGLPKPIVCAVNGVAAGAGANIAFACDIVVAARSARFIQSFAKIGLISDSGGTWILPRLVGQARALGLALTAEPLSAEQAAEWGLIWKAVDDDRLAEVAGQIAAGLAASAPLGLAAMKQAIRGAWSRTLDEQLDHERDTMRALGRTGDYREGVAAFKEKRPAQFHGR